MRVTMRIHAFVLRSFLLFFFSFFLFGANYGANVAVSVKIWPLGNERWKKNGETYKDKRRSTTKVT